MEKQQLEQLREQVLDKANKERDEFTENLPNARLEKLESLKSKNLSQQEIAHQMGAFDCDNGYKVDVLLNPIHKLNTFDGEDLDAIPFKQDSSDITSDDLPFDFDGE